MGDLAVPEIPVIRQLTVPVELRADAAEDPNSLGLLEIRFSAFDVWYRIESFWEGEFMERTSPGAFKQTIREDQAAMRSLFDHGFDPQIGNKVLGPIRSLTEEKDSPLGQVPLFDTSYNRDLLPGLKACVYGSSFRMRVREEKWNDEPNPSETNPKGLPERTITNVRLFEFGPVTFPANPEATASMRSATDHYMELLHEKDGRAFADAVRSVQRVRPDFTGDLSTRSGGRGERMERGSTTPAAGSAVDPQEAATADLVLRQRHLLLREKGIVTQ